MHAWQYQNTIAISRQTQLHTSNTPSWQLRSPYAGSHGFDFNHNVPSLTVHFYDRKPVPFSGPENGPKNEAHEWGPPMIRHPSCGAQNETIFWAPKNGAMGPSQLSGQAWGAHPLNHRDTQREIRTPQLACDGAAAMVARGFAPAG